MPAASASKHVIPCQNIEDVLEWMNGNGKPGAKVRLALIEDGLVEIKETLKWVRNILVGLLVTLIGGVMMWFFTTLLPKLLAM
jgi:hypothetical protein